MSKKYSNETLYDENLTDVTDEVIEDRDMDLVENSTDIEEVVETKNMAVVTNCQKLNIRVAPSLDSDILCKLDAGSTVVIDLKNSTDDFYNVITETGLEGYGIKKYIM